MVRTGFSRSENDRVLGTVAGFGTIRGMNLPSTSAAGPNVNHSVISVLRLTLPGEESTAIRCDRGFSTILVVDIRDVSYYAPLP